MQALQQIFRRSLATGQLKAPARISSVSFQTRSTSMKVVTIPVLGDSKNYAYLLVDKSGKAAAVDPAEPKVIVEAARREGIEIDAVLTTHKHWDHAGGNDEIQKLLGGSIPIYGGINDNCQGATKTVQDGDQFKYHDISITAIETPFHTMGHICYLCKADGAKDLIFTGDTLFVGGCGRFFEGSPADAYKALSKLEKLPDDTVVWCGHNYTASNLKFAQHVDPANQAIREKVQWTNEQDKNGQFTVPSTIGTEKQINVFLRYSDPEMQKVTGKKDPVDVLGILRKKKDSF